MSVKTIVKERKLRLRFITSLSESEMKTKLLLEFLTSRTENESTKDKCAVAVTEEKTKNVVHPEVLNSHSRLNVEQTVFMGCSVH